MPDMAALMVRQRREQMRWFLMLALDVARPAGSYTELLLAVMQANYPDATHQEVRLQLDYLKDRKLVDIRIDPTGRWFAELTRYGVDVVEYTVEVEPGIARPQLFGA